ncbi:GntR family transcriptional regulator [Chelativorans sp. YIM 93263]|uniref:GntR family transcriptional regulator n=1 Tax=Chelativorans sp. YIM 93263 TaxID=2906648 RepID=UPI0023781BDA|nr:GntR family transcriptional regulator [Chelativorans sp. YIM 93263]
MLKTDVNDEHEEQENEEVSVLLQEIADRLPVYGGSSGPLYQRLSKAIRSLIETGVLRGEQALPSERELVKATGLSRITVRNAMKDLAREGLISKRHGAGTYVSRYIDQPLSVLIGFTADMARRGAESSSIVLEKTSGLPSPDEILKLGLSPNDQVFRLSRVRLSNGEPLAIENAVVPLSAIDPDNMGDSLYEALREKGNFPVRALQRLRSAIADEREAELLGIASGSPILHIERRSFFANGRPIEVTNSAYRGDRYDFIAELKVEQ